MSSDINLKPFQYCAISQTTTNIVDMLKTIHNSLNTVSNIANAINNHAIKEEKTYYYNLLITNNLDMTTDYIDTIKKQLSQLNEYFTGVGE